MGLYEDYQPIVQRPEMRAARQDVQRRYAEASDMGRVAAGYAGGFAGTAVADRKADEAGSAWDAHRQAQTRYEQAVNRAGRDIGLPPYVEMSDPYGDNS